MTDLTAVLQQTFGFTSFRPGQRELIEAVLGGRDALGVLPTGSGKTLCYQLSGRLLPGTMVVVEPLLALMDDQVARLQTSGEKRVVALTGQLSQADFATVMGALDQYRFVFVAPETLTRPDVLRRLTQLTISALVVDEAHCISQWGPDFRPAYLKLGAVVAQLQPRAVLALTATAPTNVQADIEAGLHLRQPVRSIASVDRPNVYLGVEAVADQPAKLARLTAVVQTVAAPTIVYFDRKAKAEQAAAHLASQGIAAAYYHAGLGAHDRDLIQRRFMADALQVICATSAFGMGIDKPDVRLVVYMHVPESLEAYSQGIGRAGRDGLPSASLVLMAPGDYQRAEQFAASLPDQRTIATIYAHPEAFTDFADPQISLVEAYIHAGFTQAQTTAQLRARLGEKAASFDAMGALLNASGCRRAVLLQHFDSPVPAHTAHCCGELTADILARLAPGQAHEAATPTDWRGVFAAIFK